MDKPKQRCWACEKPESKDRKLMWVGFLRIHICKECDDRIKRTDMSTTNDVGPLVSPVAAPKGY